MIIYGCVIEIWNGSKFSKWRMIYYGHKHILSLLHHNRHISSLTIRNHIDSKHCFTIWIKPSQTFRNETKCPNRSPLPGRFGNQNKTHPVLARLLYIGGWSYLNIQFFLRLWDNFICWWCSESLDVEHKTQRQIIGGKMMGIIGIISCIYLNAEKLHIFHRYLVTGIKFSLPPLLSEKSGNRVRLDLAILPNMDHTFSPLRNTSKHLKLHKTQSKLDLQENDWFIWVKHTQPFLGDVANTCKNRALSQRSSRNEWNASVDPPQKWYKHHLGTNNKKYWWKINMVISHQRGTS